MLEEKLLDKWICLNGERYMAVFRSDCSAATVLYHKSATTESTTKILFKLLQPAAVNGFRTESMVVLLSISPSVF